MNKPDISKISSIKQQASELPLINNWVYSAASYPR